MKRTQLLIIIVLSAFVLCLFTLSGYGQEEPLTVNEIDKIELYKYGRIQTRKYSDYEIIPEGLLWKCYYRKDETTREFVRIVFDKELKHLLEIVNLQDTGVNPVLFPLEKKALVAAVDSMKDTYFKPAQKKAFIKSLADPALLESAIKQSFRLYHGEPTWFTIDISLKNNKKKILSSLSYGHIYELPWKLNEKKLYHPDISKIFATFLGDKTYADKQQEALNQSVLREIYNEEFQTRFNWENLKADHSQAFARLGNTLEPWRFRRSQESSELLLNSVLLPENFKFGAYFKNPDTVTTRIKQMEDRTLKAYNQSVFMKNYLQEHTTNRLYIGVYGTIDNHKSERKIMEKLKFLEKLPNVASDQGIFISVQDHAGKPWGKWILLPDDRLISMKLKTYYPTKQNICKIYSANGELLEDWGELDLL